MSRWAPRRATHLTVVGTDAPMDESHSPTGVDSPATSAVAAHGLLGNLAVIRGLARVLLANSAEGEENRTHLLEMIDAHVDVMHEALTDLIDGLAANDGVAADRLG